MNQQLMRRNCRTWEAFKIDEAGYADILKQVRDGEFEQALHERLELAEREKRDAIALAKAEVTNTLQKAAAAKDTEIQALKAQLDAGELSLITVNNQQEEKTTNEQFSLQQRDREGEFERLPVVAVLCANYDTQF